MTDTVRPKIGLLALTLELYETLSPKLREGRQQWLKQSVIPALSAHADVLFTKAVFRRQDVEAAVEQYQEQGADALLVVLLTYSPSQVSLPALVRTSLPIVVWNTQELFAVDDKYDGNALDDNHGVHGTQDLCNVLLRSGVKFHYVTSHLQDAQVMNELVDIFQAARAAAKLRRARLGLLGYPFPGMGDFALDTTHLAATLGCSWHNLSVEEYILRSRDAGIAAVNALVQEYRQSYEVAPDLTDVDLQLTARAEIAMAGMVADNRLDAITYQFTAFGEDERTDTLPFVAAGRLMARGIGFGGEGDLISAAGTALLNWLNPPASFTEMFTIDFAGNGLFMSHMGEANVAMAPSGCKIPLVARSKPIVRTCGRQLVLVTTFKPGPVTLCTLTQAEKGQWRLIAALADVVEFGPLKGMPVPHFKVVTKTDVRDFLSAYARAGGPHHLAVCFGDSIRRISVLADMIGANLSNADPYLLLGLDLGTTNVKVVVTRPDGQIVATGNSAVLLHHVDGGGVEQDIDEIWSSALTAIKQSLVGVDASTVKAVGVSSQGGAIQITDAAGKPLGSVISWLDGRGQQYAEPLTQKLGTDWFASHIGHGGPGWVAGDIRRLKAQTSLLEESTNKIAFVGDTIVRRLCGCGACDITSMAICMLADPRQGDLCQDYLTELGIDAGQLPLLASLRNSVGGLTKDAAAATGLSAGIPVSPALHDQYAAALGSGVVHSGDVMFGAGTAWVILALCDKLPGVINEAFLCPHPVEGLYGQMLSMANGGSAVKWALKLLGLDGQKVDMDAILGSIPAGSDSLIFWPLLVPGGGIGLPPGTGGELAGLQLSHTPGHILRAVIEGLAMELKRYLALLKNAGISISRLVMSGGGSRSKITPQIIADVTGVVVTCSANSETSAIGAAVIARGLIEKTMSLAALSESMTRQAGTFSPGPNTPTYKQKFERYLQEMPGR